MESPLSKEQLRKSEILVLAHRYLYYVLNTPVISDRAYDELEKAAIKILPSTSDVNKPGSDLDSSYSQEVKDKAQLLLKQF